ncbi:MAG: hypothetical protein GY861_07890 [bacterium]|nr:hypothetical protein [bacterium]
MLVSIGGYGNLKIWEPNTSGQWVDRNDLGKQYRCTIKTTEGTDSMVAIKQWFADTYGDKGRRIVY